MPCVLLVAKIVFAVFLFDFVLCFQIYFLTVHQTLKLLLNIFCLIEFKDLSR